MPDKEDQPPVGDCAASDEHPTAATAAARDTDSDTPHLHGPPVHAGDEFPVAVDRNDAQPERDDASELGSIDASLVGSLPRRPASPVGSVGSGPAESLQVCCWPVCSRMAQWQERLAPQLARLPRG